MPLQMLLWRHDGTYLVVEGGTEEDPNITTGSFHVTRSLAEFFGGGSTYDAIYPEGITDERELMNVTNNSDRVVYARKCTCADATVFCPVEAEYCRVWETGVFLFSRRSHSMKCETPHSMLEDWTMRFFLPIIMCLYLFLSCFVIGTKKGKNAVTYTKRLLCCWEEEQYQQVLVREVEDQARESFREAQRRARIARLWESPEPTRKVPACIKTKQFDKTSLHQECIICLADFVDGDRVGDLKCGHTFHIDPCLKQWVERKNHCPLCHVEGLAVQTDKAPKPKPEDELPQDSDTGISTQSVMSSIESASRDSTGSERLHEATEDQDPQV